MTHTKLCILRIVERVVLLMTRLNTSRVQPFRVFTFLVGKQLAPPPPLCFLQGELMMNATLTLEALSWQ